MSLIDTMLIAFVSKWNEETVITVIWLEKHFKSNT